VRETERNNHYNQMVEFAYFYHFKNKLTNQTSYLTRTPIEVYALNMIIVGCTYVR